MTDKSSQEPFDQFPHLTLCYAQIFDEGHYYTMISLNPLYHIYTSCTKREAQSDKFLKNWISLLFIFFDFYFPVAEATNTY